MGDIRDIRQGLEIPTVEGGYADQPFIVVNEDGSWLCVVTTGPGEEGAPGQHVAALVSEDLGQSWGKPVALEDPTGPESSYAAPLKTPSGRVYVFYNYNRDNLREVIADPPYNVTRRVDTQGAYVYRYSDDGGRTWSKERYEIPVRAFELDRANPYGGEVRFFWSTAMLFIYEGVVYQWLYKVGRFGAGFLAQTEGVLLASDNLLSEPDPAKHRWQTLPEGEVGVRIPGQLVNEEHSTVVLSDGTFYTVFRTAHGLAANAISRDRGRTWQVDWLRYGPGQRVVKHPRAANFVWKCGNGKYVYWFHNHGGAGVFDGLPADVPYEGRNPAWACGGVERDGTIQWSEPEVLLYDPDIGVRMSYPCCFDAGGRYYITETQKTIARVHEIAPGLLEGMWKSAAGQGKAPKPSAEAPAGAARLDIPELANLTGGGGFSLELWLDPEKLAPWQTLVDCRDEAGQGLFVQLTDKGSLRLQLLGRVSAPPGGLRSGGLAEVAWESDPGLLALGQAHQVVFAVDGGPKLITVSVDGKLNDGGTSRQFGWGRFLPQLADIAGRSEAWLHETLLGVALYSWPLRSFEVVAAYRTKFLEKQR